MIEPTQALDQAQRWGTIAELGGSQRPLMAVDLRGLDRSFRAGDRDRELAGLLTSAPWVTVAVVDDSLDPVFAELAEAFDVVVAQGPSAASAASEVGVETDDPAGCLADLERAVQASPAAAVALAQLLRISHALPVPQALHAESLTYAVLQTGETFGSWLAARSPNASVDPGDRGRVVAVERQGSLLRITLDRPDKRNALDIAMRDQLTEALELLDLDRSIDGAILCGAGQNFSAGGDLDEFGSTPSPAIGHRVRTLRSLPALMHRVRDRVRVHVHGTCVGAGIELPAFASSIVAHPDATFRLPEIAFGLIPGAGGTVSVTRRCGRHRTAWLALTGHTLDASQALRWRLVDRIDASVFDPPPAGGA